MINDLSDGLNSYFKVFPLIHKFHLKKYFFISGLISLIIGLLLFSSVYYLYDDLGGWMQSFWRWEIGKSFIDKASSWIAGSLISIIALLSYKYIIMIILSPIQSIMSSRVEAGLNGYDTDEQATITSIVKDLVRGLRITFRNLTKEILFTVFLLLISFIPAVAFISGPAILLVQAYYAGFGNMDYYMERHMSVRESASFVKRHKGLAIANGGIFLLMLLIPIVGLIIAPTFATVASSVEVHKRLENF